MQTIEINKDNALKAYQTAGPEGKALLSALLGKQHFLTEVRDRLTCLADAFAEVGLDPKDPRFTTGTPDDIAYQLLKLVIVPAYNGNWKANYDNQDECKYWPIFYLDFPGFRFGDVGCGLSATRVTGGSRLAFARREDAEHAAKVFHQVFHDFYC